MRIHSWISRSERPGEEKHCLLPHSEPRAVTWLHDSLCSLCIVRAHTWARIFGKTDLFTSKKDLISFYPAFIQHNYNFLLYCEQLERENTRWGESKCPFFARVLFFARQLKIFTNVLHLISIIIDLLNNFFFFFSTKFKWEIWNFHGIFFLQEYNIH